MNQPATHSITVAERNDETLRFLKAQDFQNAMVTSSSTLAAHRAFQAITSDALPNDGQVGDCLDECMLLSAIEEETIGIADDETFVYKHGITLPPTSLKDDHATTAILIFNTALAHHLAAESSSHTFTSHRFLFKARRLYELAYNAGGDSLDENLLFQFAVINNIMAIDRRLAINGTEATQACFEHLFSILMILVDQGCDTRLRHLRGFLVNFPSSIKTAAAA